MDWIRNFQLFLFDFDGLLVNTEALHYQAYCIMMQKRGFALTWSFAHYCTLAHLNATAIRDTLYAEYPELPSDWAQLYEEKKEAYLDLLTRGKIELMRGVEPLLSELARQNIKRCVVTHSQRSLVELIRAQHPILQTIPVWITREDYNKPKPAPECYLKAIELYGKKGDHIIGFEDTIRGLRALQQTPALPILICPSHHPLLELATEEVLHFESLDAITHL